MFLGAFKINVLLGKYITDRGLRGRLFPTKTKMCHLSICSVISLGFVLGHSWEEFYDALQAMLRQIFLSLSS